MRTFLVAGCSTIFLLLVSSSLNAQAQIAPVPVLPFPPSVFSPAVNRSIVSVIDFGAIPNSGADTTPAFNAG